MDLSGPGIDVKLKEIKKKRYTKYGDFKRKKLEICPNPPKKSW
jgi:hypothetical protein